MAAMSEYCLDCLEVDRMLDNIAYDHKHPDDQTEIRLNCRNESDTQNSCPSCHDLALAQVAYNVRGCYIDVSFGVVATATPKAKLGHLETFFESEDMEYDDAMVFLLERDRYPSHLRSPHPAPDIMANIDVKTIKQWLLGCEDSHDCCTSVFAKRSDIVLYFIDVFEERVTLRRAVDTRYAALSYVWGNSHVTKLTSQNISFLEQSGSLSITSREVTIPRSIRDAMRLAAGLGIRFLWVDCLCILQDDPRIGQYLAQMHVVYSEAYVTLIAAEGSNADSGIIQLDTSSGSRVLPGHVINYPRHALGIFVGGVASQDDQNFRWTNRGWTLQEGFFSKRALVFHKLIRMVCATGCIEEGYIGDIHHELLRGNMDHVCAASRKSIYADGSAVQKWSLYSQLQREYNRRTLSYDADVLKAFSGITDYFGSNQVNGERTHADSILYGHPLQYFEGSLLWSAVPHTLRKRILPTRLDGFPMVPSWSWFGYQGDTCFLTTFTETARFFDLDIATSIKLRCHNCQSMHAIRVPCCSDSTVRTSSNEHPADLYLQAQRAQFTVDRRGTYMGASHRKIYTGSGSDPADSSVVFLDDAAIAAQVAFYDESQPLDFVGICYDTSPWKSDTVHALCVLEMTNRPDTFARIGVCEINKDAWDMVAEFDTTIVIG